MRSANFFGLQQGIIGNKLEQWQPRIPTTMKLVRFLDQKYANASLSVDQFTGRDRALCNVLEPFAKRQGFLIFLANIVKTRFITNEEGLEEEEEEEEIESCIKATCLRSLEGTNSGHDVDHH